MHDTSPAIASLMARMIANKTPAERLKMASGMFDMGKKLIEAGLLKENCSLTRDQLRTRIFLRLYADCYTPAEIRKIVAALPDMESVNEAEARRNIT